jgi:hypothetical protein
MARARANNFIFGTIILPQGLADGFLSGVFPNFSLIC